ncbi:MAG: M42 family peptidase [Chloroflexi bacterium]|nr:M42 family peptidase [Chloroflexota bacterium]
MTALADLLTRFSQTHGTSGNEDAVRALVVREFQKLADDIQITTHGSVIGIRYATTPPRSKSRRAAASSDAPRLLVEAHIDEIGLVVTGIQDGFIRFDEIGYWDPRVLPSQNVLVHGRKTLPGVIGARPPHVLSASERKETLPLPELFIDVGMSDVRVRALVNIGDSITMDRQVTPLQNDFYSGKAFDDRAALVALLEFLRQLQNTPHAWDVYAVANVNEEDSALYLGALTSAFQIRPHVALCLDVTHAYQPGLAQDELARLGQGPCIARGANVHPFVFEKLRQAALSEAIPHHINVYGGDTETNAWMMQVAGEGIPTGLVEIPLRYMHTPVETLHLDDVARAAELVRVFATSLTREDALALHGETFVYGAQQTKNQKPKLPIRKKRR